MSEYKDPWWAWLAVIGTWAIAVAFCVGIIWFIGHFVVKYW
jgi:heme/copper-type cytochrome/quinol oxidase subunit 4